MTSPVCLTGDLHHQALGTGNQRHCPDSELAIAARYLALVREAGVKVTFYVSGLAFRDQWDELRAIADEPLVELGGHTWSCFTPALPHRVWKKLGGAYNGPRWWVRRDAERTIEIAWRRTGRRVVAWRNHMYMHGPGVADALAQAGITSCSDEVAPGGVPRRDGPLVTVPINVIPDHEHIYHAERTPEWVEQWRRRYRWRDGAVVAAN